MNTIKIPNRDGQKDYHMKIVRKTMLVLGIWPIETGGIRRKLYELYFWTSFSYYMLFILSQLIFAILNWSTNALATASTMGVSIEYLCNAYKVMIFKSKTIKDLLQEMKDKEQDIFESNDEDIVKIHMENAASNRKGVLFYTYMGFIGGSSYFIAPLVNNAIIPLEYNNVTGVYIHYYVIFSWFPFDGDKYYWAAYLIQLIGVGYGASYIIHCGAFYISLLSFITSQLKIMQHFFIKFSKYADKFKHEYDLSDEQAQVLLVRTLVEEHLKIIHVVKRVNDAMNIFTLLNFLISSFQMSLVAYQIFKFDSVMQQTTVVLFFAVLTTQLYLTYSAGHDISTESERIATCVFQNDWIGYHTNVIKMLKLICMRAQKPLLLTIGPIAEVQVTSLFQIFKAIYSYICLIINNDH